MANDQHQRGGTIVYDSGGFGLTEDCERALNVIPALTTTAAEKVELCIIISGSDLSQHFAGSEREGRPAKVGVNDNSCSVDDRLDPGSLQLVDRFANKVDNDFNFRDLSPLAQLRELAPDKIDNQRARQIYLPEQVQDRIDSWNGAARSLVHSIVHIKCLRRRRMIRPIIAADGVRNLARTRRTFGNVDSRTQSSRPPLVWASASNIR